MLTSRIALVVVIILYCAATVSHAGTVNIVFAESDAAAVESAAAVTAPVRVEGDNEAELTLIVVPLTATQYMAQPATYANSCDRVIERTSNDPAEVEDFNPAPVETVVASDATDTLGRAEFDVSVPLIDDTIEEPLVEYFLLWLNASQNTETDTIRFDPARRCIRVDIEADSDESVLIITPLLTEVNEDAGTVELMTITKNGDTELPITIQFNGGTPGIFSLTSSITLQPSDVSTTVSVTIIDDTIPEDNIEHSVQVTAGSRAVKTITFTIMDNDMLTLGFTTMEVSVIEGETVSLTVQVMDGVLNDRTEFFRVFTDQGKGNATDGTHYNAIDNPTYFPGDLILIQTIDDDKLERSRQFEVRVEDPNANALNILNPNHVIVTIRDNDGTPNKPTVTNIEFNGESDGEVSVTWNIEEHELRPIQRYIIIYRVTGDETKPKDKEGDDGTSGGDGTGEEDEMRQFNITADVDNIVCKRNATGNFCQHTLQENIKIGKTYNVIVCAENEYGRTCGEVSFASPTAAPLVPEEPTLKGLSPGTVAGIVIGVLLAILLCCLLWIFIFLICCCCIFGGEREKTYFPEKKEKENQKLQEKYNRIRSSESPIPPDSYNENVYV